MQFYKPNFLISTIFFSLFSMGMLFAAQTLSPDNKTTSDSTFHSLNDIYNLIITGATTTPNSETFTTNEPVATTSHSVSEIYSVLANLVKREDLKTGITILGVTGNYNNPDPSYSTVTPIYSSLTPSEAPNVQGFTLEDIYNLITNNATTTSGEHSFTNTLNPSMHTTTEIYDALINLSSSISSSTIRKEVSYLGTTGIYNLGGSCTTNSDCPAGYCGYNSDRSLQICTNGETDIDYCISGSECSSGFCSLSTNLCISGEEGMPCTSSAECASGYCSDINVCESVTLTSGLVGYWNFDTDADTSTYGLIFDGVDDRIDTGIVGQYSVDENIEIHLSFSTATTSRVVLLGNFNGTSAGTISAELNSQVGKLRFYLSDSTGLIGDLLTSQLYNDGLVHDVTYSYDGHTKTMTLTTEKETVSLTKAFTGTFGKTESNTLLLGTDRRTSNFYAPYIQGDLSFTQNNITVINFESQSNGCFLETISGIEHCNIGTGTLGYGNKPTTANDLSIEDKNGTYVGDAYISSISAISGNALVLDGNGDYINFATSYSLGDFTVSGWAYMDRDVSDGTNNALWGESTSQNRILLRANGTHNIRINNISTQPDVGSYSRTWNHYVTIRRNDVSSLYIDGVWKYDWTVGNNVISVGTSYIGKTGSYYLKGLVDEIAIWNRAISAEEILQIYNEGNGMSIITP